MCSLIRGEGNRHGLQDVDVDPTMKRLKQITEVHEKASKKEANKRAEELLGKLVGIPNAKSV